MSPIVIAAQAGESTSSRIGLAVSDWIPALVGMTVFVDDRSKNALWA
jgi:hypothetical protein